MRTFRVTAQQRRRLRAQLKPAKDAGIAKRVFDLLALDGGAPPARLAATLGVTRQTLYNSFDRLEAEAAPRRAGESPHRRAPELQPTRRPARAACAFAKLRTAPRTHG
jgi:hypothetical protein